MIRTDAPDLTAIARALRADAPELLPELRKEMKSTVAGAVASAKSAAMAIRMDSPAGRTSSQTSARARVNARYTRSLAVAAATGNRQVSARRYTQLVAQHTLRAGLARGIASAMTTSKGEMQLAVRTRRAAAFLTSRSSTRSFRNYGKWRHPIIHPRRLPRSKWTWVEQRLVDPMWWDDSIAPHAEKAQADAEQALDRWTQQVAALIDSKR